MEDKPIAERPEWWWFDNATEKVIYTPRRERASLYLHKINAKEYLWSLWDIKTGSLVETDRHSTWRSDVPTEEVLKRLIRSTVSSRWKEHLKADTNFIGISRYEEDVRPDKYPDDEIIPVL